MHLRGDENQYSFKQQTELNENFIRKRKWGDGKIDTRTD